MNRNLRIRMLLEAGDRVTKPLRDIAQGSSRAAQALKATRDRLKDIQRAQADVAGFRELKAGLKTTEQAMRAAQTRVGQLAREIGQAEKPSRALSAEFARAKREAAALKGEHADLTTRTQAMRDRMAAAGIATNDLARHERELRAAAARATDELRDQERQLESLTDRQRRFSAARERFGRVQGAATGLAAGGAAAIGTGIAMAAPLGASVRDAAEFESTMTDIGQKADLSREATRLMGIELIRSAKAANQFPAAMQEGVDTLAGFGLALPDARAMVVPIGRAATAYKAEMKDMAAASFAAHDNLKVAVSDTARMIDIMAQAGKAGAFEMKDMAQYFPELTAGYQALGQKGLSAGADLAAALQITRKGTGDSASAATNLSNILQKMASPDTIKNFEKMGVDLPKALKRMYAEGKTPIEAISELTNKTLKGDLSRLGFLFGDMQVQQGLRPLIQNMEEYRRIRAEALDAKGTTDTDFADRLKDNAEKMKRAQIGAKALSVTLGTALMPLTSTLADKFASMAEAVSGWAARNPRLASTLAIAAALLAGLFVVLGGGAILLAGLVAPFAALSAAATFLGIGLLPVIGIAAGVFAALVALAGIAYLIYANWGAISAFFAGLWGEIKAGFAGGIRGITTLLTNFSPIGLIYSGFAALLNLLGVKVPMRLTEAGRAMIQGLISGIGSMLGALRDKIVNVAGAAATWFKQKLGIRSPSRVFMGFGGHIVEGLTLGIARSEDDPVKRMASLSQRLSGVMNARAGMNLPPAPIPDAPAAPPVNRVAAISARATIERGDPAAIAPSQARVALLPLPSPLSVAAPTRLASLPQARSAPVDEQARTAALSRILSAAMDQQDRTPAPPQAPTIAIDDQGRMAALSQRLVAAIGAQGRMVALSAQIGGAVALGASTPAVAAPAAAVPPSRGGAQAAPAGPVTINIYPQPGQNAQDIARAVRDELAKARREDAARGRSSFNDTPDWS